ncbi:MAG: acyltransferase family protein, partial [Bacteroidales bacterium]|nr:acyltransferase family protein [Bacteroidales bacterium]
MSQRNTSISIAKGIAIILMVVGHAECPGALMSLIYLFHMPLFFITAGYFFTRAHADEPWQFCAKRFKGLYVPFVKWSIFFLLIHNLMFSWGILNETYGNWSGGVTHPYTFQQGLQRAVNIVFSMGSYDEFLAGAFWFFRALLITSILFLILYRLLDNRGKSQTGWQAAALICLGALGFAALKINYGLRVSIVQGGIRETWGMFFFGFGVIFRILEQRIGTNVRSPWFWATIIACLAVLAVGTHEHWAGM